MPRLEALQEKRKQIDAQIQAIRSREARHMRARDTRRKIVLGGAIMKLAVSGKIDQKIIDEARNVMTERDRALFDEWVSGKDWAAGEATPRATEDSL